jgi:large subunit ribosomal protein L18
MKKTIKRRRREAKTDYKARLVMLKSGEPRLVVRKTNRYIIVQIVKSEIAQDKVIVGLNSKILLSKGWPKENAGSLKSKTAAYLTGYLIGKEAKGRIKSAIFDIGMYRNLKKSRLYAVLKGAIDAGLKIKHNPEILPQEKDIAPNKKLEEIFKKIKPKIME